MPSFRVVGPGRAGGSVHDALAAGGWTARPWLTRGEPLAAAAAGVDFLIIATRDAEVAEAARSVDPVATTAVVHLAGSMGAAVLSAHPLRAAVHPLVSLPNAAVGARRLRSGAWFGITAPDEASLDAGHTLVDALGGRAVLVPEESRTVYHAAACAASNHLVTLLAQVGALGEAAGVPLAAFVGLVAGTLDNVGSLGPASALTGPVVRGDWETVRRHLDVMPPTEAVLYRAMVEATARLAGRDPAELSAQRPASR